MSHVVIGGARLTVKRASLELYHLEADEADWNLELSLTGSIRRLRASGIIKTPPLPGPSVLDLHFIDEPQTVVVDGREGTLTSHPEGSFAELRRAARNRAQIEGRPRLLWHSISGSPNLMLDYFIELSVGAAVKLS